MELKGVFQASYTLPPPHKSSDSCEKKHPTVFCWGKEKAAHTHTHTKAVPTQAAEKHTGLPLMKNKWMINWTNATWNKMYLGQKKLLDDEILINSLVTEKDNEDSFQNFSGMCWLKKDVHPTHAYYVPIFLGPNRLAISAGDGFVCTTPNTAQSTCRAPKPFIYQLHLLHPCVCPVWVRWYIRQQKIRKLHYGYALIMSLCFYQKYLA